MGHLVLLVLLGSLLSTVQMEIFKSEALLVPEHCQFDHERKSKGHRPVCMDRDELEEVARDNCAKKGMKKESHAPLMPCGKELFSGVEFVCCPVKPGDKKQKHHQNQVHHDTKKHKSTHKVIKKPAARPPIDAYQVYMHSQTHSARNEHAAFRRAKDDLKKHQHHKVTKMMKEWAAARERVQAMRASDPKGADKLQKEITARFQKTYKALEQEGESEKNQLIALHQQRVQATMNDRKRHAMEHYMDVLERDDPTTAAIMKALRHYVKTEQKDRMHTVNHFKHLKDANPIRAEEVRQQTLDHLKIIDQRMRQAIDMLNRVPKYEKKIRVQIEDFLKSFHEIDTSIARILVRPNMAKKNDKNEKILKKYKHHQHIVAKKGQHLAHQNEVHPKPVKVVPKPVEHKPKPQIHHVPLHKDGLRIPEYMDDEVMENEHDTPVDFHRPQHVAHIQQNKLGAQMQVQKVHLAPKGTLAMSSSLGIAVGTISVLLILVVAIVVLRRRGNVNANHGFVEVDQGASPEERHVANMQVNGYENPTYKYFEMNGNSQQQQA